MRHYTVPPVIRAFPQEWINGKVPTSAMAIENIRTVDEANEKRALARDPDGVLLEIFERPDWVPAADHSVMLGVGVTVNDLELFSEDLVEGFNFQPEADLFEHARHWDLDGSLEKCRTIKLGDMFVVASRYRDSRQRPNDYKLGDIGISDVEGAPRLSQVCFSQRGLSNVDLCEANPRVHRYRGTSGNGLAHSH